MYYDHYKIKLIITFDFNLLKGVGGWGCLNLLELIRSIVVMDCSGGILPFN
jgi:hypothetical protein